MTRSFASGRKGTSMTSKLGTPSKDEERPALSISQDEGVAPAARPRRKVNQAAIRRLFLGKAAAARRQSGKDATRPESRMAIEVVRPSRLRVAVLEQTFSTPFSRLDRNGS